MADEPIAVKDAASFLLAIKETTGTSYDADAVEYLQLKIDAIRRGLDKLGITDEKKREEWIFFDGMLKGSQLQLLKGALREGEEIRRREQGEYRPPKLIVT